MACGETGGNNNYMINDRNRFKLPKQIIENPYGLPPLFMVFNNQQTYPLFLLEIKILKSKMIFIKHLIKDEKTDPNLQKHNYSRIFLNSIIESLRNVQNLLKKFEHENFLSSEITEKHRLRLEKLKFQARKIIIKENLPGVEDLA